MNNSSVVIAVVFAVFLASCGGKNTECKVEVPGEAKSGESKLLDTGADLLQDKSPLGKFNAYLNGFHSTTGISMHKWKPIITSHNSMRIFTRR